MSEGLSQQLLTRRNFIAVGILSTITVLAACGTSKGGAPTEAPTTENSSPASHPSKPDKSIGLYVPDYLDDPQYEQILQLPLSQVDRFNIAFALPRKNGEISQANIDAVAPVLGKLSAHQEVLLSIGGYGENDDDNKKINSAWGGAISHPQAFARSVAGSLRTIQDRTAARVGVDLDFEYPTSRQAAGFTALAKAVRAALPEASLTVAVPAVPDDSNDYLRGFDLSSNGLPSVIDTFNVMTYDMNGPWPGSETAGPIATLPWTVQSIAQWVKRIGNQKQVAVGFPGYGYRFPGARKMNDPYKASAGDLTVAYRDLPANTIHDDVRDGLSEARVKGDWTSCMSPHIIGLVAAKLHEDFPDLGGAFYWSAEQILSQHLTAVAPLA